MRVLVASWLGSDNLGDELIFRALRDKLRARGAAVAGISVDPQRTRRDHGVGAVGHLSPLDITAAVGSADRVVFGGGGLLQDETSRLNLPYHLARLGLARATGTPAAVVGIGAGPITSPEGRVLARLALRDLPVSARDRTSVEVLRGLGVPDPVVAADPALSLPVPDVEVADHLTVALRPWAGGGVGPVGAREDVALMPEPVIAATAAGLDAAARATGLPVRFVALQAPTDDPLHRRVADRMESEATFASPGVDDVIAELAAGRIVVATRYHGGIGALLGGRPMVLLGYSPKVPALAEDVGTGAIPVPWDAAAIRDLAVPVEELARDLDRHSDAVAGARDRLRERERANDRVLDDLLDRPAG